MIGLIKSLLSRSAGIPPREAAQRVQRGGAVLIDVREPGEQRAGMAAGAYALPLSRLRSDGTAALHALPLPEETTEILLICQSGMRSRLAQGLLAKKESRPCVNVDGGMLAWARAGLPIARS